MVNKSKTQQTSPPEQSANNDSLRQSAAPPSTAALATAAASAADGPDNAAAAAGSTAQPRASGTASTPLHHLNNTTAKLSQWDVEINNAHEEEYEYMWEGNSRTGKVFTCHLVYVHDPEQYCVGEVRKEKTSPQN